MRADSGWGATPFSAVATHYIQGDSGWGGPADSGWGIQGDSGWGSTPVTASQADVPAGTTTA